MTLKIDPRDLTLNYCFNILSPVSHNDATLGREANMSLYNRQRVRIPSQAAGKPVTDTDIQRIAETFPVPVECVPIFEEEPFARFVGIGLIKVFIDRYSAGSTGDDWGTGIFTGVEAYRRLSDRIEMAAPRAATLKEFWSLLLKDMQCGPIVAETRPLFSLLAVPSQVQHAALFHLQKYAVMMVEMARHWIQEGKLSNAEYAKKAKAPQTSGETQQLTFTDPETEPLTEISVPIPQHSGNDIRHDIRYAGMVHLFSTLGLGLDAELPTGVKALFENGGNIGKGKAAPSTAYALTQTIREKYPLLGLVGGCTDSFILGESNLHSVSAFWYGREYNDALEHIFGVTAEHSVLDMLDQWTLHRHVGRYDGSPMPYSFETIVAGAKLYVSFQFSPWMSDLEFGAFAAALKTYQEVDSAIGGQSAKGFGKIKILPVRKGDRLGFQVYDCQQYEAYLIENRDELVAGLKTGTLGTDTVVCT